MTRLAAGLADTPGSVFPCRVLGQGLASVSQPLVCPSSALSAAACPQLWRELIQLLARFPRRSRHCIIATAAPTVRVHEAPTRALARCMFVRRLLLRVQLACLLLSPSGFVAHIMTFTFTGFLLYCVSFPYVVFLFIHKKNKQKTANFDEAL